MTMFDRVRAGNRAAKGGFAFASVLAGCATLSQPVAGIGISGDSAGFLPLSEVIGKDFPAFEKHLGSKADRKQDEDGVSVTYGRGQLSAKAKALGVISVELVQDAGKVSRDPSKKHVTTIEIKFGNDVGWKKAMASLDIDATSWQQKSGRLDSWYFWFASPMMKGVVPGRLINFSVQGDSRLHEGVQGPGWGVRYIGGFEVEPDRFGGMLTLTNLEKDESMAD